MLADGLLITNVTASDGGVYICKATERVLGDVNEINITLKVERKYTTLTYFAFIPVDWENGGGVEVAVATCEPEVLKPGG